MTVLREVYPDTEIHVAADGAFSSLFPCLPAHHTIPLRRAPVIGWYSLLRQRYDICLDFNASDRSSLTTFLLRCPRKITYTRFQKRLFRKQIYDTFAPAILSHRHTADFHLDLLNALGIYREGIPLNLQLPSATVQEVKNLLASRHIVPPFIIVHPGTFRPEKYWVNERWLAIIDHLHRHYHYPILLTGSRSAQECHFLQSLLVQGKDLWHDLTGKLDLAQLAVLISQARLLCGVDSAPIHMSDAVSTPCVALFGPTNPYHWGPRNPNSCIVAPHQLPYQSKDKGAPMETISTDSVVAAIDSILAKQLL